MNGVAYARLEGPDGSVLAEMGVRADPSDGWVQAGEAVSIASLFDAHTIQVSVPIQRGSDRLGAVVMLNQTEGAMGKANAGLMATLFGAALAGLAGMAVAYRMQASISGPIVGLTRAMAQVRETRSYHLGAELKSDDEVGDLIEGFNGMLSEIRQRDLQLANHVATLEREVDQRTVDLLAAKDAA
jgi:methyl-accepting chemotaxis protein